MKKKLISRVKLILIAALVFNIALVLLTLGLNLQATLLNPIRGSLVAIDDADMHVIESLPEVLARHDRSLTDSLVLIHGASTSALDFANNLLPRLSERFRVVAIDRPGHGYSDRGSSLDMYNPKQQADAILDTLARMQITEPVIVGHSLAGAVVMAALLAKHEQVVPKAGILIAGVTHPWDREDSLPTRQVLSPYTGPVFAWQYLVPLGRIFMASTVEQVFAPDEVPENYIRETGLYLSLRPTTYRYNALDRTRFSDYLVEQSAYYSEIKAPVLSIAASEDQLVPPFNHHEKLIRVLDNVSAVVVEGSGHAPHHARTDEVVAAIETFINDLDE